MHAPTPSASVPRRLGAAFYDLLVVVALWMLVYYPLIAFRVLGGTLDDNRDPRHWLLRAAIAFLYFAFCWTRGGRTLGLRSWGLALARHDGAPVTLRDAAARFSVASAYLLPWAALESAYGLALSPWLYWVSLLAPFLFGLLWSRADAARRPLHERVLLTRIIRV